MFRDIACKSVVFLLLASFLAVLGCTTGAKGKEISKEDAEKALAEIFKEVKVISMEPTPVKGLNEVVVESKGEKGIVYIDTSGNYIFMGSMLDVAKKSNITKERIADLRKVDTSAIPLEDALVMGDPGAKHRVIVFSDTD
jgi:thiol:disulfide interchange protein DsbC